MKSKKIKATYKNGVIEPLDAINLPEGQELEVEFSVLQKRLVKKQRKPIRLLSGRARGGGSDGYWKSEGSPAKNAREVNC